MVSCQIDLQRLKWSKNIWPEHNKNPKPAFSTVLDVDKIHKQVLDNLKLQSILLDRFNTRISDEMLQDDLDRTAANTKDAKGLKQLFSLFDNDVTTIAQCIARPYLVKSKAQSKYNYDSEIHGLLKVGAQAELQAYLGGNNIERLGAQVNTVIFAIEQQEKALSQKYTQEQIIELSKQEFTNKIQQLQNNSLEGNRLQEKAYGFIYTELIQQTQDELTVKTLSWQKPSLNLWVQNQSAEIYAQEKQSKPLKLPEISGGRYDPATDSWQPTSTGVNVPDERLSHTAIWTGSQMIIWGGGYDDSRTNTGGRYDPNFHSEVGGNVTGLLGNQLILQNNGVDDLSIDANGTFIFATALDDLSTYDVTVLTQPTSPNQTCVVTGGTGSINGAYIVDVSIECNTEPTAVADAYTINEDETLTANDVNGSVNDANDDVVLANDSDAELNPLSVLNPGTFTATGVGGTIVISTDGTFIYTPPADISGQADFDFEVTDGFNVVSSSLSINVLAVNDIPSFTVFGGIDVIDLIGGGHTHIRVTDFAGNIIFGPADEGNQNVQQFNLSVDDNDSILTDISISNNGTLDIDFSLNYGLALIDVILQDDGGVANGGVDTSIAVEFFVAHLDLVFADGFETSSDFSLFDYLESISMTYPHNNHPIYDFNDDNLHFYGHTLQLDNDYGSAKVMLLVKHWLQAVLIKEDSLGDYDQDGVLNTDDPEPFIFKPQT